MSPASTAASSGERVLATLARSIPLFVQKHAKAKPTPRWQVPAERFFKIWPKISVCSPKYADWLKQCSPEDLRQPHIFMNDSARAQLIEYYLCCALVLSPDSVEAAGENAEQLLKLAEDCAKNDVEPILEGAHKLALEYNSDAHQKLEKLTVWREVDDALFWHHSFKELVGPKYLDFVRAALPGVVSSGVARVLRQRCR